jgi:hypothetical protein
MPLKGGTDDDITDDVMFETPLQWTGTSWLLLR